MSVLCSKAPRAPISLRERDGSPGPVQSPHQPPHSSCYLQLHLRFTPSGWLCSTLASLLLLKNTPASGPLHLLFLVPGMLFPQIQELSHFPEVTHLERAESRFKPRLCVLQRKAHHTVPSKREGWRVTLGRFLGGHIAWDMSTGAQRLARVDTGVIIGSVEGAELVRDCLLRRQDMSQALKVGIGNAMRSYR